MFSQAFEVFDEAPVTFKPTYKFIVGTDNYNTRRKPAWTDRILYKVRTDINGNPLMNVTQTEYKAHFEFTGSDHKPVSSLFKIDFPHV